MWSDFASEAQFCHYLISRMMCENYLVEKILKNTTITK